MVSANEGDGGWTSIPCTESGTGVGRDVPAPQKRRAVQPEAAEWPLIESGDADRQTANGAGGPIGSPSSTASTGRGFQSLRLKVCNRW
jgi:hypothetical protein